ncbi:hypothetical protein MMC17_000364 [Xylographa soralifera]|nr:hypothetical protein [Xylographa soralifera]
MPMATNGSTTPYPTAYETEEIFLLRGKAPDGKLTKQSAFDSHFTDDAEIIIMGQDHQLKGNHSKEDFKTEVQARISKLIDYSKPGGAYEVIRVVGGGDTPYAAIELKTTGTTKAGKPFVHEYVYMLRYNSERKITQMKGFFDSQHINSHVEENEGKAG